MSTIKIKVRKRSRVTIQVTAIVMSDGLAKENAPCLCPLHGMVCHVFDENQDFCAQLE